MRSKEAWIWCEVSDLGGVALVLVVMVIHRHRNDTSHATVGHSSHLMPPRSALLA